MVGDWTHDRATLEPQFIIFPTPDSQYDYWPSDWTFVPKGYDQLLATMDTPTPDSFVPAESWIGNVHANLEELEELFTAK